jgi:hypothetical protein
LVPQAAVAFAQPDVTIETHTFPAQHNTAPGLITLTPATLVFTPLLSTCASVTIPLAGLRGVKKTGMFKGLSMRFLSPDAGTEEKEERFRWVGGRDELFARLIGVDGQRWMKA